MQTAHRKIQRHSNTLRGHYKLPVFSMAFFFMITAMCTLPSIAHADEVDALLREADRALGRSDQGSTKEAEQKSETQTAPSGKVKPKAKKKPSLGEEQNPTTNPGDNPSANSGSNTDPSSLTPADAETVRELTAIGLRRETQLRPDEKEHRVGLAFSQAWLRGRYELKKDDDTFRADRYEILRGLDLNYSADFNRGLALGTHGTWFPTGYVSLGYLRGRIDVLRSGVENGTIHVDYNLVPAQIGLGLRWQAASQWRAGIGYGPTVELLIQTGRGTSDSTSGLFLSDTLEVHGEKSWSGRLWLGLSLRFRGLILNQDRQAGLNALAITVKTPISG